ncbi:MAG: hypothetical protein ACRD1D_07735 [Acidimicrobiales bacterium]
MATAATAQTTTSTSTSTSTTTSSTSSTTSTTIVDPCRTEPCTADPPPAFLSGVNGEVALDQGSYCWRGAAPDARGLIIGRCVDMIFDDDPDAELIVQAGETLTLRFGALTPTEVILRRDDVSRALVAGNPLRFVADLPVGSYVVGFFTRWTQGDASYGVRLVVRAATSPRSGVRISLTG